MAVRLHADLQTAMLRCGTLPMKTKSRFSPMMDTQYKQSRLINTETSHYLPQAHLTHRTYIRIWRSDTRSSRTMIKTFIRRKMVQSHCFCHTVMDRRVADVIPWRWLPILFTGVILVISVSVAFIRIEVSYTDKGRLSGIGQINPAEILNMASNNVKQIRRGAANVLGNWARALQGEEGDTLDV
ncbi:hypothetical protein EDD17DRAFT_1516293 [Pisolithus thermaeus]|nr:hypothetical protein EDD17DRAFT_1516293 [Pisolithus thermaeus]